MDISILKRDLESLYNLDVRNIEIIRREDRRPCYKVITENSTFFVKVYDELHLNVIEGLKLLDYLREKGYPAIKVYKSKRGNYIEVIDNTPIALFEWIKAENVIKSRNVNLERSKNLRRSLGLLHKLTMNYEFPESISWGNVVTNVIGGLFRCKTFVDKYAPGIYKEIFNKTLEAMVKWEISKNVPKSVLHGEFTYEHVLFKGNEVYRVIDWDPVNRGWCFQDLGITLYLTLGEFGEEHMHAVLEGYKEIRPLTEWEEKNLNNILLYGFATLLWWYTDGVIGGYCKWEGIGEKAKEFVERALNKKFFIKI